MVSHAHQIAMIFKLIGFFLIFTLQSMSDSKRQDCGCSCPQEAENVVWKRQKQLQNYIQTCNYRAAQNLALSCISWISTDRFCKGECCYDIGNIAKWWSYYNCYDHIAYPAQPQYLTMLSNGTAVISLTEIIARNVSISAGSSAYYIDFFWFPIPKVCDFRLGFIKASSLSCPASLPVNAKFCSNSACS